MTAIAGLWRFDGQPDAAESCARMLVSQQLYGPHAGAQWSCGDVAVGRRLMRVLPEDAFDRQPLVGGGGRYVLVADIRLDNRDELIAALGVAALTARTLSDAAILLVAIERWGESCFDRLLGDYAFALWDGARRRLLLARDPLGQRPLHYHRAGTFFAFASMPKGLHALAEVPYAPDEDRIAEFLVLIPETGTQSFFHGIERVEPGHFVVVTSTALTAHQHWQPSRGPIVLRRPQDYVEALREQLDNAVRRRLRGVDDVGAHLSGGLDSSAVATTAARLLALPGRRVVAFTAVPREGYDGPASQFSSIDEGPNAAATAAMYPNMEHVLISSEGRSPLDDLDRSFLLFDRPVLNICNIGWLNSINDAARNRKLSVLLTGYMGNMGLSYSGRELLPELIRGGQWLRWWQVARNLVGRRKMRWRRVLADTFGPWCPAPLWVWLNRKIGNDFDFRSYTAIHPRRFAELDLAARARMCALDLAYRPWTDSFAMRLWGLRRIDFGNYNKGILGGWQIDQRDATADIRLLEFCLAVPTEKFFSDGTPRALARSVLFDRLPKQVLEESRSDVQAADWHERLTAVRGRVSTELDRLDACPPAARAIDLPRMRRLVDNWPTKGWERDGVSSPYRLALLRAISAGHFMRRTGGGNR